MTKIYNEKFSGHYIRYIYEVRIDKPFEETEFDYKVVIKKDNEVKSISEYHYKSGFLLNEKEENYKYVTFGDHVLDEKGK